MRVSPILSLTKLHPWPLPSNPNSAGVKLQRLSCSKAQSYLSWTWWASEAVCLIFPSPLFVFSVHWDTTRYRGSVILWMSSSNSCPIQSARVGIVLSWKTRVLGSQYLTCLLSDFDLHASSSQTRWSSIIQFLSKFYLLFIHSIF